MEPYDAGPVKLKIPTRDDWTMSGNANVTANQFIGTTDETDLEFRANNQPQLRLGSDGVTEMLGGVKMLGVNDATAPMKHILIDPVSGLLTLGGPYFPDAPATPNDGTCWSPNPPVDLVGSWTSGIHKVYVCPQINVGIGTQEPAAKLDVLGQTYTENLSVNTYDEDGLVTIKGSGVNSVSLVVQATDGDPAFKVQGSGRVTIGDLNSTPSLEVGADGSVLLRNGPWLTSGAEAKLQLGDANHYINAAYGGGLRFGVAGVADAMVIDDWSGNVSMINDLDVENILSVGYRANIGAEKIVSGPHTDYALSVDGKIVAKEFIVTTDVNYWADFVFEENYQLRPILEVATYIENNHHLPDVPSEKDVRANGQDLGKMDAILLRKIEELTLYVIELQRQIEEMKK